jgi:hypothetical protein
MMHCIATVTYIHLRRLPKKGSMKMTFVRKDDIRPSNNDAMANPNPPPLAKREADRLLAHPARASSSAGRCASPGFGPVLALDLTSFQRHTITISMRHLWPNPVQEVFP